MSFSYDPSLGTDKDWIRFRLNDTVEASAKLQDEEIEAINAEEANKHIAAADCLEALMVRWMSAGEGVMEKQVSKLRIKFGSETSAADALQNRIDELRKRGRFLQTPRPRLFRAL